MNCIIIDDEAVARAILKKLCSLVDNLQVVGEFSSALKAIQFLNTNEVDLIFLDIHLPGVTGFDFIDTLKDPPRIVFTTSDTHHAAQAFEYDFIIDYLLKPISLERFKLAVQKVANKAPEVIRKLSPEKIESNTESVLYVNIDRRLVKIDMSSIYLIEAKGDYISIKTDGHSYIVHSTLKKIEDKLPNHPFLKVHRSYIINVDRIVDIEANSVLVKKELVPVSRSKKSALMQRLNLL